MAPSSRPSASRPQEEEEEEAIISGAEALEEIQRLNREDVAATRRMVKLVKDTRGVSDHVAETVAEQGQQIKRTKGMLAGLDSTLRTIKVSLKGAMRIGNEEAANARAARDAAKDAKKQQRGQEASAVCSKAAEAAAGEGDEEREISNNLDEIDMILQGMKTQAVAMGQELDRQNKDLHKVDAYVETGVAGVRAAAKAVDKQRGWQSHIKKIEDDMKAATISAASDLR